MTDGEKMLGMIIAGIGAELGRTQTGIYGVRDSYKNLMDLLSDRKTTGVSALGLLEIDGCRACIYAVREEDGNLSCGYHGKKKPCGGS